MPASTVMHTDNKFYISGQLSARMGLPISNESL